MGWPRRNETRRFAVADDIAEGFPNDRHRPPGLPLGVEKLQAALRIFLCFAGSAPVVFLGTLGSGKIECRVNPLLQGFAGTGIVGSHGLMV